MPTFALIGHCGPDTYLLKNAISRAVPDATILFANDQRALESLSQLDRVLLINRVLDRGFDVETGVELIERLARGQPVPIMMLISNYADAQEQAVAAGAHPGFGKRDLNLPRTADLLRHSARMLTMREAGSTDAHRI